MPMTAREAAFKTIGAYRRDKNTRPIDFLNALTDKHKLDARDSALATQLVRGILQNTALCDYYASKFSSTKLSKLEPQVLDILRLSIYQILYLTKVPKSAAVNEGTNLAKKYSNSRAAGFINAVLRSIANAAENGKLPEVISDNEVKTLAIKYSHPEWLVNELIVMSDISAVEKLLSFNNNSERPIFAQVNTLITTTEKVISMLEAEGINAKRHTKLENCIELFAPGNIANLDTYKKGLFYVQDPASMFAVIASGVSPGDFVIDACAAPGGKSFAAAIMMKNQGKVLSEDNKESKLKHISEGAKRLGINVIETKHSDATECDESLIDSADVVIADVPCSGFGVIHKKPEIRYKNQADIKDLPDIQKQILSNVSRYVKPGKVLMYSTCTLLKCENDDVIDWFLERNPEFSLEKFALNGIGDVPQGKITLMPHIHETDGFFICKMRRVDTQQNDEKLIDYAIDK
jgi:16S rRNA (cytosine967-C5)-methyltransferase